ncbi:MAG TPA: metallophosphoesterase [Gemmatimonas sp.]|nr:metallophosphoesterase [Gemmatimonas sp.]
MNRFVLYLLVVWSTLAIIAWGAIPASPGLAPLVVVALALYVTVPLFVFMRRGFGWRAYPTAAFRLYVVRPILYTQLLLPIVTISAVLGLLVGAMAGAARAGGQIAAAIALVVSGVLLLAGWRGSRSLVVRDVEAFVPSLPAAFDGFRIVQVSDLHLGPQTSRRFLADVTNSIRGLSADLITVTGDLIDDRVEDTGLFVAWLDSLGAPPHGVYLIPGNHDVYAGWASVRVALERDSSAHVLVNESQLLTRGGAALALVGLGDPAARRASPRGEQGNSAAPDVPRAFSAVPAGVSVVAFAHNPALWPSVAERGAALTLSGHTHWGQFALPRLGWSLASPFLEHAMGAYQDGEALLYVHPGTGFWGIPFRLGALPEVTVVTLRQGASASLLVGATRAA